MCKILIFPPHIILTEIMVFWIIYFRKLNRIEINGKLTTGNDTIIVLTICGE